MLRSIILDLNLFADVGKMVSPVLFIILCRAANLYVNLYVNLCSPIPQIFQKWEIDFRQYIRKFAEGLRKKVTLCGKVP